MYASYLGKGLALSEQIEQLGDHLLASPWVYVGLIKHTGLLQDQTLLNAIEWGIFNCIKMVIKTKISWWN